MRLPKWFNEHGWSTIKTLKDFVFLSDFSPGAWDGEKNKPEFETFRMQKWFMVSCNNCVLWQT